jgi:hypothetical protein
MQKIPRIIKKALSKHGIKLNSYNYGETEHFYVRILSYAGPASLEFYEKRWVVQFGYRPTFDRWANSTNFETEVWYSPFSKQLDSECKIIFKREKKQYTIPHFDKELEWCLKCAESGIFDFNSYFRIIETPWFIH